MIHKQSKGYTLIELLIALAIGLAIVLVVYGFVMGLNKSQTYANANGYMQERAQFIFNNIGRHIKIAGYYDPARSTDESERHYLNYAALKDGNGQSHAFIASLGNNEKNTLLPIQVVPTTKKSGDLIVNNFESTNEDYYTCDGHLISEQKPPLPHAIVNIFWLEDNKIKCKSVMQNERRKRDADEPDAEGHWQVFADNTPYEVASGIADMKLFLIKYADNQQVRHINLNTTDLASKQQIEFGKRAKGLKMQLSLVDDRAKVKGKDGVNTKYKHQYKTSFSFANNPIR